MITLCCCQCLCPLLGQSPCQLCWRLRAASPSLREQIYWTVPGALVLCCCFEPRAFSSQLLRPDGSQEMEKHTFGLVVWKALEHNLSCTCDQFNQIAHPSPRTRWRTSPRLQNLHTFISSCTSFYSWCVIHDITSHRRNGRRALFILYCNNIIRSLYLCKC